jgi:hypothetical protein
LYTGNETEETTSGAVSLCVCVMKQHKNRESITSGRRLEASPFNTDTEMLVMSGGIESAVALDSGMMSSQTSKRYSGAGVCARRRYSGIDYIHNRVAEWIGR